MSAPPRLPGPSAVPTIGCLGLFLALLLICLMPLILFDVMQTALQRLHLTPLAAGLLVAAIFLGSVVNIPVYRFTRDAPQPEVSWGPLGHILFGPHMQRLKHESVIALNLGGCIIPCLIALWQVPSLIQAGDALWRLGVVAAVNIGVCYCIARPVEGIGIMIPGLVSPLVAVLMTWLLCPAEMESRVAIAYVAGILGPLVGADLLHLKDITRVSVGTLSIGGAGTFDGIVLSGILAALLA
jgi:uncharacterized membrane protein